jgi:hypothetical protein
MHLPCLLCAPNALTVTFDYLINAWDEEFKSCTSPFSSQYIILYVIDEGKIRDWWIGKYLEGSGRGLIDVLSKPLSGQKSNKMYHPEQTVYERRFERDNTRIYAKSITTLRAQNYTPYASKLHSGMQRRWSQNAHVLNLGKRQIWTAKLHSSCFTLRRRSLIVIWPNTGQISEQQTVVTCLKEGFRNLTKAGE